MREGVMTQAVTTGMKKLLYYEGELLVKMLESEEELRQAYRLRHRVFAERLKWVQETENRLETDVYDSWSTMVGLFSELGHLIGVVRMTHAPVPFMLESEFSTCLVSSHKVRKALDTAEITRLAVDPDITDRSLSTRAMCTIIKGAYQWCLTHDVRYTYFVVEKRLLRALRLMGWPCRTIGAPITLPPAGAVSVASLLDLDEFRLEGARKRPEVLKWFSTTENIPIIPATQMPALKRDLSTNYDLQWEAV